MTTLRVAMLLLVSSLFVSTANAQLAGPACLTDSANGFYSLNLYHYTESIQLWGHYHSPSVNQSDDCFTQPLTGGGVWKLDNTANFSLHIMGATRNCPSFDVHVYANYNTGEIEASVQRGYKFFETSLQFVDCKLGHPQDYPMLLLARKVYRIGVQSLYKDGDNFYAEIKNRTYHSIVQIPLTKVQAWCIELTKR